MTYKRMRCNHVGFGYGCGGEDVLLGNILCGFTERVFSIFRLKSPRRLHLSAFRIPRVVLCNSRDSQSLAASI